MMLLKGYTCSKCKQTVYSRDKNDIHTCFCSNVECTGKKLLTFEVTEVEVNIDATIQQLRLDFLYNQGKFGTIQPIKEK